MIAPSGFSTEISFEKGSFADLSWHITQECVFPVIHQAGGVYETLGTCFSITGDGLCMTARHVVEKILELADGDRHFDVDEHGPVGVMYMSTREPHPLGAKHILGGPLPIAAIYHRADLDIALLHLHLPRHISTGQQLELPVHKLRLGLPSVDDPFVALGYPKGEWSVNDEQLRIILRQMYVASHGSVKELHPRGRDSVMLPFPCFRTSARFDGGMSGGPICAYDGSVVGVVCSSFDTEEESLSYGSLIGPSMGIGLQGQAPGGQAADMLLWDFVEGGAIKADTTGFIAERRGDSLHIETSRPARFI